MKTIHCMRRTHNALLAACLLLPALALAQTNDDWPKKPIKMVVPFSPGGSNDNIARLVSIKMGEKLGQPVIVENKVGSGGLIGSDSVAKSAADGYTLLFTSSSIVTNAVSGKKVLHDPQQAFTPIGKICSSPFAIVTANKVPGAKLADFIAYAKQNPEKVHYGTAGVGGMNHLATELFAKAAGIQIVHVPYKGISQSYNDLMGGSLEMMLPSLTSMAPHILSGKVRGLAVTSKLRSPLLPDVPTAIEAGLPGFELEVWFGLMAPAALPARITQQLNTTLNQVLADPEVLKAFAREAVTALPGTPDDLKKQIAADTALWKKVIRENNIKINEN
jgi:tripartite-type tricarboxylate transporter receptor subunit TctC